MLNRMVLTVCRSEDIMIQKDSARDFLSMIFLDDGKVFENMESVALKMTIFQQFRHALTRHDPKTYSP